MDDDEKKVTLNEQSLTKEEFEKKKNELEKKPGVSVVKISEDAYRSRIKG
jgi:hypothetical protein